MTTESKLLLAETATVDTVGFGHRKIYTDIIIDASPEQVWSVLTDTTSYEKWAVFMVNISDKITDGESITVTFQINPKKDKLTTITHTITVEDGKTFYWAERGPMGICDNHHFIVEPLEDGKTRFIQSDELTKGMTWLLGGMLSKMYVRGYGSFNQSLKTEVERRFPKH